MTGWRKPLYGVGAVPPSEAQQECVCFVVADRKNHDRGPVATATLVGLQGPDGQWFPYFVTAAHAVRNGGPRWVRLRSRDGGQPVDMLTDNWIVHDDYDLAATPCSFGLSEFTLRFQEEAFFSDKWPPAYPPAPGARAYFIGLLENVAALRDAGIPMVRGAIVGALGVPNIKVRDITAGLDRLQHPLHLIDCYSRAGFSGSPVYVESHQFTRHIDQPNKRLVDAVITVNSALFGILIAHLTDAEGDQDRNAGVALVVPVEGIRQLLDYPELRKWREERAMEHDRQKGDSREDVATADSLTDATEDKPLGRDERVSLYPLDPAEALRAFLNTPKDQGEH